MLSLQQIFDKVATHLLVQGKRSAKSVGVSNTCQYRGHKGTSCAVGCLIPDNVYDEAFDAASDSSVGTLANSPAFRAALTAGGVDVLDSDVLALLVDLQNLHDELDPKHWARGLRDRAQIHGLNADVVGGAA